MKLLQWLKSLHFHKYEYVKTIYEKHYYKCAKCNKYFYKYFSNFTSRDIKQKCSESYYLGEKEREIYWVNFYNERLKETEEIKQSRERIERLREESKNRLKRRVL